MAVKPSCGLGAAAKAPVPDTGAKPGKPASAAVPAPRFIVAYSGGLDSTVLLHVVAAFFGPDAVLAIHVNHRLQQAAGLFEAHARATCRAWGIPLRVCQLEGAPAKGESIEAWARQQRYHVLNEVAREQGIGIVMTAHHQDDQIESLLIALSRGAGLEGLRGIAAGRDLMPQMPDVQLHRPLLSCSREDIEAHAQVHDLKWVEDPSNQDHQFLRNRIRAELLPVIRRVLPGFSRQATRSMAHISAATRRQVAPAFSPGAMLSLAELRAQDGAGQALMLRQWLRAHALRAPSQARLEALLSQMLGASPSLQLALGEASIRKERGLCWIEMEGPVDADLRPPAKAGRASPTSAAGSRTGTRSRSTTAMPSALQTTARGWIWHLPAFKGLLVVERRPGGAEPLPDEENALRALQVAVAGSRQKMWVDEARPRRTLKNLFQEAGIPAALRGRLPCVLQGEDVLFVAGIGNSPTSPWLFHFLPDL